MMFPPPRYLNTTPASATGRNKNTKVTVWRRRRGRYKMRLSRVSYFRPVIDINDTSGPRVYGHADTASFC